MDKSKSAKDPIKEQTVTYDIYAAMPDDGHRYEIIDGTLEMMSPSPSANHQSVRGELSFILMKGCRTDYMIFHAPLDVILSETNVVQPDILMIHRSRLSIVTSRGVEGPPDMVAEILSPGSRNRDKVVKMKTYAKFGVPEYWLVDTESRTLEQYRLLGDGGQYELRRLFEGEDVAVSDLLQCVTFVIGDIFKEMRN